MYNRKGKISACRIRTCRSHKRWYTAVSFLKLPTHFSIPMPFCHVLWIFLPKFPGHLKFIFLTPLKYYENKSHFSFALLYLIFQISCYVAQIGWYKYLAQSRKVGRKWKIEGHLLFCFVLFWSVSLVVPTMQEQSKNITSFFFSSYFPLYFCERRHATWFSSMCNCWICSGENHVKWNYNDRRQKNKNLTQYFKIFSSYYWFYDCRGTAEPWRAGFQYKW